MSCRSAFPSPRPGRTMPRFLIHRENAANDPLPPAPPFSGPRRRSACTRAAACLHRLLQLLPIGVALRGARREALDAVLLQARLKLCELGARLAVLARPAEALALRPEASARLHRLLHRSRVDVLRRPTLRSCCQDRSPRCHSLSGIRRRPRSSRSRTASAVVLVVPSCRTRLEDEPLPPQPAATRARAAMTPAAIASVSRNLRGVGVMCRSKQRPLNVAL